MSYITGLDLSLTGTGIATWDGNAWHTQVVVTKPPRVPPGPLHPTEATRLLFKRIGVIRDAIRQHLTVFGPGLVVVEQPLWRASMPGGKSTDRAGLWWLVWQDLLEQSLEVVVVNTSSRSKYATGKGNAAKMVCMAAAIKRYPDADIPDDNAADAVTLAAMGARALGEPVEHYIPAPNLEAMRSVDWPAAAGLNVPTG